MTYGQIKLRLTQAFPGVSLDLIEGWINDRYQEILGELPWTRLTVQTVITTFAGQAVYTLPSNCGLLREDAFPTMTRFSFTALTAGDPTNSQTGEPLAWASCMDDNSTPPNMQVQVYPVPDGSYTLPLEYEMEVVPLNGTSTILQAWVQPSALIEGATAKIKAHLKDYTGAQFHIATGEAALKKMRKVDAQNMGLMQMRIDPYFTSPRRQGHARPGIVLTPGAGSGMSSFSSGVLLPTFIDNEIPAGAIDGTNRAFTLANTPNPATSLHLQLNGLGLQGGGVDFTLTGATIVFVPAAIPQSGDSITASYRY